MARQRKGSGPPAGGGTPAWLCTYGDMMSLLLTFFILLFSLSTLSENKFQMARQSLISAFGGVLESGGQVIGSPGPTPEQIEQILEEIEKQDLEQFEQVRNTLAGFIEKEGLGSRVEVTEDSRGLVVRLADSVLFDLGRADIRTEAKGILDKMAGLILSIPNHVRIEGHTDDLRINTERFPSNWELSTGRASAVIRYFVEKHSIPPTRLSAAGYGEFRPVAPNDGEANRRKNRRVDIIILKLSNTKSEPKAGGAW